MPSSSLEQISHCQKYPTHREFIPLVEFSSKHLTSVRQNPKLLNLIQCLGALTLKIRTKVAVKRDQHGKLCRSRKQNTGFIIWVNKRTIKATQSCQCAECTSQINITPNDHNENEWYELIIITSPKVVSSQAMADTISLQFNIGVGEAAMTKTLRGNCKYVRLNKDICQLHCFTYDKDLGLQLLSHFLQFEELISNACSLIHKEGEYIFSVAVSHPHGCEKHVSLSLEKDLFKSHGGISRPNDGSKQFLEREIGRVLWPSTWNFARVLYQVPMCSGSGGAIVITLTHSNGVIISLHQKTTKRLSWVKDKKKDVKHFCELLEQDEEPDRDEDLSLVVKFPSEKDIKEREEERKASALNQPAEDRHVTVLQPRSILRNSPGQARYVKAKKVKRESQALSCPEKISATSSLKLDSSATEMEDPVSQSCQTNKEQATASERLSPSATEKEGTVIDSCQTNKELPTASERISPSAIEKEETVTQSCQTNKETPTASERPSPSAIEKEEKVIDSCQTNKEPPTASERLSPSAIEKERTVIQSCQTNKEPATASERLSPSAIEKERTVMQSCQTNKEPATASERLSPSAIEKERTVIQSCQTNKEPATVSESLSPSAKEKEGTVIDSCQTNKEPATASERLSPSAIEKERTVIQSCQTNKEPATASERLIPSAIGIEGTVIQSCQTNKEPATVSERLSPSAIEKERTVIQSCQTNMEPATASERLSPSTIEKEGTVIQSCQTNKEPATASERLIPSAIGKEETVIHACQTNKEPETASERLSPSAIEKEGPVSQSCQTNKEPATVSERLSPSTIEKEGTVIQSCQTNKELATVYERLSPSAIEKEGTVMHSCQTNKEPASTSFELKPSATEREEPSLQSSQTNKKPVLGTHTRSGDGDDELLDTCQVVSRMQGFAESQMCLGPEAHLELHYIMCDKNPNHENFFHLNELQLDHLPEEYRDETYLANIHHMAALTVRVVTRYLSRKRPEFHPHTREPYLGYEGKGRKILRTGTGYIVKAQHQKLKFGQTCQCKECVSNGNILDNCCQVVIMTATHNVFDQAEANKTEIDLSYFQGIKEIKTKKLTGKCSHCVINEDVCWLEFSTHDEMLIQLLDKHLKDFQEGRLKLSQCKANDGFVAIVSHPHGSRKSHVSFGNLLSDSEILSLDTKDEVGSDSLDGSKTKRGKATGADFKAPAFQFYQPFDKVAIWPGDLFKPIVCQQYPKVVYTTPTCPGSSGALVLIHKPGVGNVVYTHWGCDGSHNRTGGGTVFYHGDHQILPG